MNKTKIFIALAVLVLAATIYYFADVRGKEETDDAQLEAYVVPVSAKVTGYVKELHVSDNQLVKAGDPLVQVDQADYQIAVDKAVAALDAATAQYEQATQNLAVTKVAAPSTLEGAKAAVAAAQADYERALKDAERNRQLKGIATSTRVIEQSNADEQMARGRLAQAQAELRAAETSNQTIAGADAGTRMLLAQIEEKKADLAAAKKALADTTVTAPQDGKITARTVETGALVQPGQTLLAVSGTQLWVVANFKETQLQHMHPGQKAEISVDAYPKETFSGTVDSLQAGTGARLSLFPPENATGNFVKVVQRVPVKIVFDKMPGSSFALAPGMSVVVTVHVQ